MKKIIFFLSSMLLIVSSYAQNKHAENFYPKREGYNEIKINNKLSTVKSLNKYKLYPDTTLKNSWILTGDSLIVFTIDVDHINITVDDSDNIKHIAVYTKEYSFENYNDWLFKMKFVINVVNGDVGKPNSDDLSRASSHESLLAWSFQNTQTSLGLKVQKVNKSAREIRCKYIFSWRVEEKDFLDVKW